MTFYRWAMRNGAIILFLASLLIFVISFANYFFLGGAALNQALSEEGLTTSKFVLFWGAFSQAASGSAWPFFGACILDRFDRHWTDSRGSRK